MKRFFVLNRSFFVVYGVLLAFAFVALWMRPEDALLGYFQRQHHSFLDVVFYVLTMTFEFPFILVAGGIFLWWSRKKFALILCAYVLSSVITRGLKLFFAHPRPAEYFESQRHIPLYSYLKTLGESLPHFHSFPSGHTTTAFAILGMCAFLLPPRAKLFVLGLATLMGVSRIYLACHFLEDVVLGSIVGLGSSVLVFLYLRPKLEHWRIFKRL